MSYEVASERSPVYDVDSVLQYDVAIDGISYDLRRLSTSRCFPRSGFRRSSVSGSDVWADEVTVTVRLTAVDGEGAGCELSDTRTYQKQASITATFTIEEFRILSEAGAHLTIPFTAVDVIGCRVPINGELLIRGSITG